MPGLLIICVCSGGEKEHYRSIQTSSSAESKVFSSPWEVAEGTRELLPSLIPSIPEKVTECRRITLGISKVCSFEHPTRTKRRTQMIQCMATGKRTAAGKGRPETSS